MKQFPRRFLALAANAAALTLVACASPPAPPVVRVSSSALAAAEGDVPDRAGAAWLPRVGRMSGDVLRRHGIEEPPARVLHLGFTGEEAKGATGWRVVGDVATRVLTLAEIRGVEIRAEGQAPAGLDRGLAPELLAGRDVRIDLRFGCPSSRRLEMLTGMKLQVVAGRGGRTRSVTLPILADQSPGWETQSWWLRFAPGIDSVRLSIEATRPQAALLLSGIDFFAVRRSDPVVATTRPAGGRNLLVDGDFETGQPRFFASSSRRWRDGEELLLPQPWELTADAASGERALSLPVSGWARVGFGPIDLNPGGGRSSAWTLRFHAKAATPATVIVALRTRERVLGQKQFALSPEWQLFTAPLGDGSEVAGTHHRTNSAAELTLDFLNDSPEETNSCLLDGLVLAAGASVQDAAMQSSEVTVGLSASGVVPETSPAKAQGAATAPDVSADGDICNVFDDREPLAVQLRLATEPGNADSRLAGTLALDLLDAWDRVVWTRTSNITIPASGKHQEALRLQLPRGYYRLLATLWSGEAGASTRLGGSRMALAAITLTDPVPMNAAFGISSEGGAVSLRSTQLGLGWVRADLPAGRVQVAEDRWDFSLWRWLMDRCARAQLEVVSGTRLPAAGGSTRKFLEDWLDPAGNLPVGVVISPPAISRQPAETYTNDLLLAGQVLSSGGRKIKTVQDLSAAGPAPPAGVADVLGIACVGTLLPETSEALLERIGRQHRPNDHLWDLGVPVRLSGAPDADPGDVYDRPDELVRLLPEPLDPVRSASRMVRALLIRSVAGAERICCDALALAPVRSIYDDTHRRLHELDLSPRVALVALETMTGLLNDANLLRWIDLPGGSRVLYYAKDDGRGVAALWRPYGLSATRLSAGPLPSAIELLDCVGTPQPAPPAGEPRIIAVTEMVQYLVAPVEHRDALWRALDKLQVLSTD